MRSAGKSRPYYETFLAFNTFDIGKPYSKLVSALQLVYQCNHFPVVCPSNVTVPSHGGAALLHLLNKMVTVPTLVDVCM